MSVHAGPDISENGLVLCLDAANAKSYAGSGTTWTDLSGNGNNGTLTNGPTYSSDNNGSIVFDGSNDYVEASVNHTNQITVNFWINKHTYNTSNPALFTASPSAVTNPASQSSAQKVLGGWVASTGRIWGRIIDDVGIKNLPTSADFVLSLNTWTNLTYVADGSNYTVYKNGISGVQRYYSGTVSDFGVIFIGAQGIEFHDGQVSNFQVYNRALSATEIRQNFNALRGRYGI